MSINLEYEHNKIMLYIKECGYTYKSSNEIVNEYENKYLKGWYVSHTMRDVIEKCKPQLNTIIGGRVMLSNMFEVNKKAIEENADIWACAFKLTTNKEDLRFYQPPVKGQIRGRYFYKYREDGRLSKSCVCIDSRRFSFSEKDSVNLYNYLIDKNLGKLREISEFVKGFTIK